MLQEHKNNRKQILEFYSKNCDNADALYATLQKQYNELKYDILNLIVYGHFEKGVWFFNYLAKLVSVIEGKDYSYKKVLLCLDLKR